MTVAYKSTHVNKYQSQVTMVFYNALRDELVQAWNICTYSPLLELYTL